VLETVSKYKLQLAANPVQRLAPQVLEVTSADSSQVEVEITKFLEKGAVFKVTHCLGQFLSRVFTVPKKDRSSRVVVNLRPLPNGTSRDTDAEGSKTGWSPSI
jgi:hypothetical protein